MIPKRKMKGDGGFAFTRKWFNELRDALMRSRVIVEKGSGFVQTPTGVMPPPISPEALPPLHPTLYDDGGQWKWTIYPGHVIARGTGYDENVLSRHVPTINGTAVNANTPQDNAVNLGVSDIYIYLELEYEGPGSWQPLHEARFVAATTTLGNDELVDRILWAEVLTTGAYKRLDYENALSGHFYANRGDGLMRLIGQVRSDGASGWEYRVTEGTVEETGSNNAVQVSKAWAASPGTKTYVWLQITYATAAAAGEWHLRMSGATIQTGAAWGTPSSGVRIVNLFAIKNNEITDVEWEGDYTWCEPLETGTDDISFDVLRVVAVSDSDCIGLERYTIQVTADFGARTLSVSEAATGDITEVKKCSAPT